MMTYTTAPVGSNEPAAQVIVVGAGPVGVLMALGLARAGIRVTLLERGASIADSPRAMVYHWSVLEGLDTLGILADALEAGFEKDDYSYLVHATGERLSYNLHQLRGRTPYPYNLHLGQNALVAIALRHLADYPNANIVFDTKITDVAPDDTGVTLTAAAGRTFRADWVVGADGAGSAVRTALGVEFSGMTWNERFVATNIRYDFEAYGYSRSMLLIDPAYGAVIAKIDETGLWRVTYSESLDLPEETVRDRMDAYFATILPGPSEYELVAFSPYRMHQRAADTFRVGRVLLAGDAAHATNPTGGLGLTTGMFDTFVLYDALAAVILGEADDSVLDRYAEERRRVFLEVVSPAATENKRLIYESDDPQRLEADLVNLRKLVSDPEVRLSRVLFPAKLQTPPLVSRGKASAITAGSQAVNS